MLLHYDFSPSVIAFSTERDATDPSSPYDAFNITHYTADDPAHVIACRQQLCASLGIDSSHLILPRQVHGTQVIEVTEDLIAAVPSTPIPAVPSTPIPAPSASPGPASASSPVSAPVASSASAVVPADSSAVPPSPSPLDGVDALITRVPRTCIGVSTADCVPILLYDPTTAAIAAIHAGWRGTVARIASLTLAAMQARFGTRISDVRAVIGPSIGPDAFEVGDEVYDAFLSANFPMRDIAFKAPAMSSLSHPSASVPLRWHIDLWHANAHDLISAGVPETAIHISSLCTYTLHDRFFSARRLGIHSGRIFTGIMMK